MAPVAFSSSNNDESLHHSVADKEVAWHGQVRTARLVKNVLGLTQCVFTSRAVVTTTFIPFSRAKEDECLWVTDRSRPGPYRYSVFNGLFLSLFVHR